MFNEILKSLREARGLTVRQLAKLINVKPITITNWEKGISKPRLCNLVILRNVLNVSLNQLMGL